MIFLHFLTLKKKYVEVNSHKIPPASYDEEVVHHSGTFRLHVAAIRDKLIQISGTI